MTEAPQPSGEASKKEEMVISTDRAFKAASEDEDNSQLPEHDLWVCFDQTRTKTLPPSVIYV